MDLIAAEAHGGPEGHIQKKKKNRKGYIVCMEKLVPECVASGNQKDTRCLPKQREEKTHSGPRFKGEEEMPGGMIQLSKKKKL